MNWKISLNSAFNSVEIEVEVEAELGKNVIIASPQPLYLIICLMGFCGNHHLSAFNWIEIRAFKRKLKSLNKIEVKHEEINQPYPSKIQLFIELIHVASVAKIEIN